MRYSDRRQPGVTPAYIYTVITEMSSFEHTPLPRLSFFQLTGLMVLMLPVGLFFIGWFEPWIAVPFAAYCGIVLFRGLLTQDHIETSLHRPKLILMLGVILIYLIVGGMVGWFPTHGDSFAMRQAMFLNLRDEAWPLILPNGREMSYYLAGMLPPAILARIMPENLQQWAVLLCSWLPIAISIILLSQHFRRASWLLLFILIAFQDPLSAFFRPTGTVSSGPGFMVEWLNNLWEYTGLDLRILTSYYGNKTIGAPIHNCIGAYNSTPYTLLATALLLTGREHRWIHPLVVALLVPVSPLSALALFPVALYFYTHKRFGKQYVAPMLLELIAPTLLVILSAVYFLRAQRSDSTVSLDFLIHGKSFWPFYIRYILGGSVLALPIMHMRRKDGLYRVTLLSMLFLPLLFVGSPPSALYQGFNELTLKGTYIYALILGVMWYEDWSHIRKSFRILAVAWLCASTGTYCLSQIRSFSSTHQVADMWNGHLNHENRFLRQSIPETKEPLLPYVLIREGGESEKHFPGNILPHGTGCDYSTPPSPCAFP